MSYLEPLSTKLMLYEKAFRGLATASDVNWLLAHTVDDDLRAYLYRYAGYMGL